GATGGAGAAGRLGTLGSGVGHFAGPMAVAAGHSDGLNSRDLYVADAHNRRIVHLRDAGDHLEWLGEARHEAPLLTSLATDQWGNVYAASPHAASVPKVRPHLAKAHRLTRGLSQP